MWGWGGFGGNEWGWGGNVWGWGVEMWGWGGHLWGRGDLGVTCGSPPPPPPQLVPHFLGPFVEKLRSCDRKAPENLPQNVMA